MSKHEHFDSAVALVRSAGYCSGKQLRTFFNIGHNSVGLLIDQLEDAKIIGPFEGGATRRVLPNKEGAEA